MRSAEVLQEIRKMRYEEGYTGWQAGRLMQEEADQLLGVCESTFRRYIDRYEKAGAPSIFTRGIGGMAARAAIPG